MQKQKINFLALQSSYDNIEVALFINHQEIACTKLSKFTASSMLVPTIKDILAKHSITFGQLNFIGANLGPAPFTTLRTTIVTLNGLSFVTKIPLVGVNGLEVFTKKALAAETNLAVILNAFNKSVYFGIRKDQQVEWGWQPIDTFLKYLEDKFNHEPTTIIGQGISVYLDELQTLPANFALDLTYDQFPKLDLIAQEALKLYLNKEHKNMLTPLYLKQAHPSI